MKKDRTNTTYNFGNGCLPIIRITVISLLLIITGNRLAQAQAGRIEGPVDQTRQRIALPELPPEISEIRSSQKALAAVVGIEIHQFDVGQRSSSRLAGVPPEFRNQHISDEADLITLIDKLYPYYGFRGSETLHYQDQSDVWGRTRYQFLEFIDGIETPLVVTFHVDNQTGRVIEIRGGAQIDRNLDRTPELSAQQTIDIAIRYVRQSEQINAEIYDLNGAHDTSIVYRSWGPDNVLTPHWQVELAPYNGALVIANPRFFIGPTGQVETSRVALP